MGHPLNSLKSKVNSLILERDGVLGQEKVIRYQILDIVIAKKNINVNIVPVYMRGKKERCRVNTHRYVK